MTDYRTTQEIQAEVLNLVSDLLGGGYQWLEERDELFHSYSREVLINLSGMLSNRSNLLPVYSMLDDKLSDTQLQEVFHYRDITSDLGRYGVRNLLNSLVYYPQIEQLENYTLASPRLQEQIRALLSVADAINTANDKAGSNMSLSSIIDMEPDGPLNMHLDPKVAEYVAASQPVIRSRELIDLILAYPERVPAVNKAIITRFSVDALLIDVMRNESSAFADGML